MGLGFAHAGSTWVFLLLAGFWATLKPHSCWLLLEFGSLGGWEVLAQYNSTIWQADFLYLWLHLQPGSQVLQGVVSASTSLHNLEGSALWSNKVRALDFILALKGC